MIAAEELTVDNYYAAIYISKVSTVQEMDALRHAYLRGQFLQWNL